MQELLQVGDLTNHTQSMDGDEQYDDVTIPAFRILEDITNKYLRRMPKTQNQPAWVAEIVECLECEGGSPLQMQREMINALRR